jgi:hypothetical protein
MAGDRLIHRHEQEVLYSLLVTADAEIAWPTQSMYVSRSGGSRMGIADFTALYI